MEYFISSDEKHEVAGEAEQWAKHLPLSTHSTPGRRAKEQSLGEGKDEGTVGEGSRPFAHLLVAGTVLGCGIQGVQNRNSPSSSGPQSVRGKWTRHKDTSANTQLWTRKSEGPVMAPWVKVFVVHSR